jgi:hypothetical protein
MTDEETGKHVDRIQKLVGELCLDFANTQTPIKLMPVAMAIFAQRMESITGVLAEDFLKEASNNVIQMKIDERDKAKETMQIIVPETLIRNEDGIPMLPMQTPPESQ